MWLAIAAALIAVLAWRSAPPLWYALTAIPYFFATLGVFQAREQTCVFLAGAGRRDLDGGAVVAAPEVHSVAREQRRVVGVVCRAHIANTLARSGRACDRRR